MFSDCYITHKIVSRIIFHIFFAIFSYMLYLYLIFFPNLFKLQQSLIIIKQIIWWWNTRQGYDKENSARENERKIPAVLQTFDKTWVDYFNAWRDNGTFLGRV